MESLQEKIARLEAELSEFEGKTYLTLDETDRRNRISNQLAEARHEQSQQQQVEQNHEERIAQSQQKVAFILDSLQVSGLTMRQLCAGDDEYELLRGKIQQLFEVQAESYSTQIRGYEEREIQLTRQNDNHQIRNNDLERENSRLAAYANELELRATDAESKRDAAMRELDDVKAQNEQLKSWNDDLHLQISRGAIGATRVIDPEEEARRAAEEEEKAARVRAQKTIYAVKPDREINPVNFTAKRVIDDEPITFNWTQRNSYIILDDEAKVLQFRLQHAPKPTEDDIPAIIEPPGVEPVVPVAPQFQDETEGETGLGMAVPASGEQETVTRQEYDALRHEVTMIAVELKARGILPMGWEAA